jgi:hypothetical protein
MPINGATQKEFMKKLYTEGKVNLDTALQIFYKSKKQRNTENIISTLKIYAIDDEIIFIEKNNGTRCSLTKDIIENANAYEVVFNGLNLTEQHLCEARSPCLNDIEINDLEDGQHMAHYGDSHFLIYGETENFMIQHERLRTFTNMVAQHLVGRRFHEVAACFSKMVSDRFTPEIIESKLLGVEKYYGTFDFFDRIEVQSIYTEKGRDKKYFDDEKLPKGIKRSQRIGTAFFQLLSDYTPNGVSHWDYTVFLGVIEEEKGLFKIYDMKYKNTY